jgi:hypothetical protein
MADVDNIEKNPYANNGGARPGSGRPKGSMSETNRLKLEALNHYKRRVARLTDSLLNKQLSLAEGRQYLYKVVVTNEGEKNERREHVLVTDPDEILKYFNEEVDPDTYYYMTTKDPDVRALKDILERAYGKPEQSVDLTSDGNEIKIVIGTPKQETKVTEENQDADNVGDTESGVSVQ